MKAKHTCAYCSSPAIAYRLEGDGTKTRLCVDHIPVDDVQESTELRSPQPSLRSLTPSAPGDK